jgi:hypothetical protein
MRVQKGKDMFDTSGGQTMTGIIVNPDVAGHPKYQDCEADKPAGKPK